MHWTFRRSGGRPPTRSLVGSLLVHSAVVVLAILATLREPEPLTFITYEIEIVSPPPQRVEQVQEDPTPAPPEEELVIERPDEAPEEIPEEAVPLPDAEPEPVEETPEETEPEAEPEETPPEDTEEAPVATEEPAEESDESGEDIEVRMEGLRRDFPEYYEGIITQIRRCFRPPPGIPSGLRTTVYFVIRGDGTVTDARFVEQSGNPGFDFEALGAITDCAGRGRFGPLPTDLPYERLPIQFEFRPPGGDDAPAAADHPAASSAAPQGDR